jgi:gamma-glutamyltranspeptidase / glutathione hydrolase
VDTYHKQIEAIKLAFVDGLNYITDPRNMNLSVEQLLSDTYAKQRGGLISEEALMPEAGEPTKGDTVH